jgi:hypothetical protein
MGRNGGLVGRMRERQEVKNQETRKKWEEIKIKEAFCLDSWLLTSYVFFIPKSPATHSTHPPSRGAGVFIGADKVAQYAFNDIGIGAGLVKLLIKFKVQLF